MAPDETDGQKQSDVDDHERDPGAGAVHQRPHGISSGLSVGQNQYSAINAASWTTTIQPIERISFGITCAPSCDSESR